MKSEKLHHLRPIKSYKRPHTSPRNDVHVEKKAEAMKPEISFLILPAQSIYSRRIVEQAITPIRMIRAIFFSAKSLNIIKTPGQIR